MMSREWTSARAWARRQAGENGPAGRADLSIHLGKSPIDELICITVLDSSVARFFPVCLMFRNSLDLCDYLDKLKPAITFLSLRCHESRERFLNRTASIGSSRIRMSGIGNSHDRSQFTLPALNSFGRRASSIIGSQWRINNRSTKLSRIIS